MNAPCSGGTCRAAAAQLRGLDAQLTQNVRLARVSQEVAVQTRIQVDGAFVPGVILGASPVRRGGGAAELPSGSEAPGARVPRDVG